MVTIVNMALLLSWVLCFVFFSMVFYRFPRFPWCLYMIAFHDLFPESSIVGPFGMIADDFRCSFRCKVSFCV